MAQTSLFEVELETATGNRFSPEFMAWIKEKLEWQIKVERNMQNSFTKDSKFYTDHGPEITKLESFLTELNPTP